MAENITGTKPAEGNFPDLEKQNKEVADKLALQGQQKAAPDPKELVETGDALDALAATKKPKTEEAEAPPVVEVEAKEKTQTPEEKAAAEKTASEAKTAADEKSALEKTANDLFKDSPALPERASPKSAEAFSAIKIKAAQEISARETALEKLKKENAELQEKLKNPVPPELEKELNDHRSWRAKMDVELDPKFKEFDKTISSSQEFIYAQLKKSPVVTDAVIAEIKKHGGPENIDLVKLFEAVKDPTMQRLVESKIADIEQTKYNKQQAIDAAKANVGQYMTDRQKEMVAVATAHNTVTKQHLDGMINSLDWFKSREIKNGATDEEKAAATEHNKFVSETKKQLEEAAADDTPQMRAILLTGLVQLFNLQRDHKSLTDKYETLKKTHDETTSKWEKVKAASLSRLPQSGAPASGNTPQKPKDTINTDTAGSLDAIAKQVLAERAAKAA